MYFVFIILHFWQRVCMNARERRRSRVRESRMLIRKHEMVRVRAITICTLFVSKHLCMYVCDVMCECVMRG
jgi:hypothetical protein